MRLIGLAVALSVCLLTSQLIPEAQPAEKVPRVGFLTAFASNDIPLWREGFRQGLRDLGYREGQNIVIEYRYADGHPDRLPALASELVGLKMDVIAAETTPASLALKQATGTIPIVMSIVADPTKSGLVGSLARPEGNITGMSLYACMVPENDSKWRDFVNHTFMELIDSGKYFELYDKWFGPRGVLPYAMSDQVRNYILMQSMPE